MNDTGDKCPPPPPPPRYSYLKDQTESDCNRDKRPQTNTRSSKGYAQIQLWAETDVWFRPTLRMRNSQRSDLWAHPHFTDKGVVTQGTRWKTWYRVRMASRQSSLSMGVLSRGLISENFKIQTEVEGDLLSAATASTRSRMKSFPFVHGFWSWRIL